MRHTESFIICKHSVLSAQAESSARLGWYLHERLVELLQLSADMVRKGHHMMGGVLRAAVYCY